MHCKQSPAVSNLSNGRNLFETKLRIISRSRRSTAINAYEKCERVIFVYSTKHWNGIWKLECFKSIGDNCKTAHWIRKMLLTRGKTSLPRKSKQSISFVEMHFLSFFEWASFWLEILRVPWCKHGHLSHNIIDSKIVYLRMFSLKEATLRVTFQ